MRWLTSWILVLVIILAASLFTSEALGVLIASDSFAISLARGDYTPNTSLVGQSPSAGASGFSGAWGKPPTDLFLPTAGGLTHPLLPDEALDGHLIVYGTQGSAGGLGTWNASRAIDYTPTDGNYYMSVLLRKDGETTRAELLAGLGQSMPAGEGVFDVAGSWIGFVDGGIEFFSGPGADLDRLLSSSETKVGETYMALLEFDYSSSGPDSISASVYNSAAVQVASKQYTDLDLDGQLGRFSVLTQDYGPLPVVDEFRFGTELSDVITPQLIRNPNHYYYEYLGYRDLADGDVFGVLELSKLPATHKDVVSLTFTDAGRFYISLFDNPALPEVYEGTFDVTTGLFHSDWEGGLTSGELFEEAVIADVDTYPGYEFVLGASYAKAGTEELEDWLGFRKKGSDDCYCIGRWRLIYAPDLDDPDPDLVETFGDWAKSKGYNPGDHMPRNTDASYAGLKSLEGIDEYNWIFRPATFSLDLHGNLLTQLEADSFSGMGGLSVLNLSNNRLTTIEDGAFRGLHNLQELYLFANYALTELNFSNADFSNLVYLHVGFNLNVERVSLRNAVLNQQSLYGLFSSLLPFPFPIPLPPELVGINALDGITEIDLSGVDFSEIDDLSPLYEMDDLTDLWLVGTSRLDPFELDALLDELETFEALDVEGVLYMTPADYEYFNTFGNGLLAVWNSEFGHHILFVPEPSTLVLLALFSLTMMCRFRVTRT